MNENKKLIVVLGVIAAIIAIIITASIVDGSKNEKLYDEFRTAFESSENSLIYIGRPTCGYCNLLNPSILDMKERYNFDYVYVNTDELSSKYLNKILSDLDITSLGTPYLAVVSNGEVVARQTEYKDYDETFKFLQTNGIISSDSKLLLNYIGIDEYKKLVSGKENSIIVVGQSTCTYCVSAKVILNDIVASNGTEINYLNVTYLDDDAKKEFISSFDYFSGSWGTPLTLIVKDGKIVDKLEQMVSKDEYISFFEKYGVL